MRSIGERAKNVEEIGGTRVVKVANDDPNDWSPFVAQAAPDVLLFARSRDYLAEILERMKSKPARWALDKDLPEWKHLDLGAPQWVIQHCRDPDSLLIGLVYCLQPGDVARVIYVGRDAEVVAARPGGRSAIEEREVQPNVIEASFDVHTQSNLRQFFGRLFCELE